MMTDHLFQMIFRILTWKSTRTWVKCSGSFITIWVNMQYRRTLSAIALTKTRQ